MLLFLILLWNHWLSCRNTSLFPASCRELRFSFQFICPLFTITAVSLASCATEWELMAFLSAAKYCFIVCTSSSLLSNYLSGSLQLLPCEHVPGFFCKLLKTCGVVCTVAVSEEKVNWASGWNPNRYQLPLTSALHSHLSNQNWVGKFQSVSYLSLRRSRYPKQKCCWPHPVPALYERPTMFTSHLWQRVSLCVVHLYISALVFSSAQDSLFQSCVDVE